MVFGSLGMKMRMEMGNGQKISSSTHKWAFPLPAPSPSGPFSETNQELGLTISSHIPVILKPFKISLGKKNVTCISHFIL